MLRVSMESFRTGAAAIGWQSMMHHRLQHTQTHPKPSACDSLMVTGDDVLMLLLRLWTPDRDNSGVRWTVAKLCTGNL
jgi:hypothetical protein